MAVLVIAADQLCKWYIVHQVGMIARPPLEITSFFNLVMVWNHGVSFGMFSGYGDAMRWVLVAVSSIISLVLVVWLYRLRDRFMGLSIGLVIGGALGNVMDRIYYGAVADFFDFHVAGYHWPAFNIADSCICIGVGLLLFDSVFRGAKSCNKPPTD